MNNGLIEDIKELQILRGISDAQLARQAGVDGSTWSKIKSGKANPGRKFLSGLVRIFPELHLSILQSLEE